MAEGTIDTLQIQISSSANKAIQAIDKMQKSLISLQGGIRRIGKINMGGFSGSIKQLSESVNRLDVAKVIRFSEGITSLKTSMSGFGSFDKNVARAVGSLEKLSDLDLSKLSNLGDLSGLKGLGSGLSGFAEGAKQLSGLKTSEINKPVRSVEKLGNVNVGNLRQISTDFAAFSAALKSIPDMSRLADMGMAFQGFASALSGADKVSAGTTKLFTALSQLAASANDIPVVIQTLPALSIEIGRFITAMSQAPLVDAGTVSIVTALSGIAGAGARAAKASAALPALTRGIGQFVTAMSKMPRLNTNVVKVVQSLGQIATSGAKAGSAANKLQGNISKLSGAMSGLRGGANNAIAGIRSFSRELMGALGVVGGIYAIGNAIKFSLNAASDLAEVQNVVDQSFGNLSYLANDFAKNAIQSFGMSELSAKQAAGQFAAMAKGLGVVQDQAANMAIKLTGLSGDLASFWNVRQDVAQTALASIFTGETETLKKFGIVMTEVNLQQFAYQQGIDKSISKMSQLEKTQLRYNFVLSNTAIAQGDFARTQDSWANQLRILTESFKAFGGIVGGVLVNAFKPFIAALNQVMVAVLQFAQVVSDALGAIFGWKFESSGASAGLDDVGSSAGDASDNLGSAAKNAKKLKDNLQGFDELNVISASDSSGVGGSGSGGAGSGSAGEWTQTESLWEKYTSNLDSLYKLGDYIGNALTNAMNNIDWDKVYEGARNFGTGLANFLNGLISPELFGAVGRTLAGALNTAIYAALSFGQTFDWANLGLSIASGLNNFFATFDFAALAATINVWSKGILNTMITALDNTDWFMIGQKIGDFLNALDWTTILSKLGHVIIDAISAAIELYAGLLDVAPIEASIIAGVAGFKFAGLGTALSGAIGKAIAGGLTLKNVVIAIQRFFPNINSAAFVILGDKILLKIEEIVKENGGEKILNALGEGLLIALSAGMGLYLGGPLGALAGGITGLIIDGIRGNEWGTKFWNQIGNDLFNWNVAGSLWDSAKQFFSNADEAFINNDLIGFGMNIIEGILNGFAAGIALVTEPITDLFDAIVKGILSIFGIHSPAKEMEPYGGYILEGIIVGFKNTFEEWTTALNEWFDKYISPWFTAQKWYELYSKIKTSLKAIWDETVGQWGTDIESWWNNNVSPWFALEKWKEVAGGIKNGIKNSWDSTVGQWETDVQSWWDNNVKIWFTVDKWTEVGSGIKDGLSTAFNAAIDALKGIWNGFAIWLNEKLSFDMPAIKNPLTGETIFGGDTIQLGKLPVLAKGGILSKGQLALLEGSGAEAVVPLEKNTQWIGRVAQILNREIELNIPKYKINYSDNIGKNTMDIPPGMSAQLSTTIKDIGELKEETRQQNELLREQNELLRDIYDKPTIQGRDVFNIVQKEGRKYVKQHKVDPWPVMGK